MTSLTPQTSRVTTRRLKSGTAFYFNGKNITALWMDFFATLPTNKEHKCGELFIKKYGNELK